MYKLVPATNNKAGTSKIDVEMTEPKFNFKLNHNPFKKIKEITFGYGGFIKAKDFNKSDFKVNNLEYAGNFTFTYFFSRCASFKYYLSDVRDLDRAIAALRRRNLPDSTTIIDSLIMNAPWNTKKYFWISIENELKQQNFATYSNSNVYAIISEDKLSNTKTNIYKLNVSFNFYHYITPNKDFGQLKWGGNKYFNVNLSYYRDNAVNFKQTQGTKFIFYSPISTGVSVQQSEVIAYDQRYLNNINTWEINGNYYFMTLNKKIGLRVNPGYKVNNTSLTNNVYLGMGFFGSVENSSNNRIIKKVNVGTINYELFVVCNNINDGGSFISKIKPTFKFEFPFNSL